MLGGVRGRRLVTASYSIGQKYVWLFISIICAVSLFVCSYYFYKDWKEDEVLKEQQEGLKTQIENTDVSSDEPFKMPTAGVETILEEIMNEEYEPIYSPVYYQSEDVFKYYKFFQADTQEEFDDWYNNIMELSLYDTGVRAEFGDEFITLSCCAYHVEDGRFVVVGKRIH